MIAPVPSSDAPRRSTPITLAPVTEPTPEELLKKALTTTDEQERSDAIIKLKHLDYSSFRTRLLEALYHKNSKHRQNAAFIIGELGDPSRDIQLINERLYLSLMLEKDSGVRGSLDDALDKLVRKKCKNLPGCLSWVVPPWLYKIFT